MFADRNEAGNMLALRLLLKKITIDYILGITRGGVVVSKVISEKLEIPHFPFIVKKIGAPFNPEYALGAVTYDKFVTLDLQAITNLYITQKEIQALVNQKYTEVQELQKDLKVLLPSLTNKTVLIVDDGVATGETVKVAALYAKAKGCKKSILATPVISKDIYNKLLSYFSSITTLKKPNDLTSVGEYYRTFNEVTHKDLKRIL